MTPASLFDLMDPRHIARGAAAFAMGFAVSHSDLQNATSEIGQIRTRDELRCGVDTGLPGFAEQSETGAWRGFEVDLCRAYAAALLGSAEKAVFVPLTTLERFSALEDGAVDILLRNTSWTLSRSAGLNARFVGVYYYDGQGFLAPSDLGLTSAQELERARICVQPETTSALNLSDFSERYDIDFTLVLVQTVADAQERYESGECDAFTSDVSQLAGFRRSLNAPERHTILPDIISKEPLGPVVRAEDPAFAEAAQWVLMALVAAEEFGVTAERLEQLALVDERPEIRRLLSVDSAISDQLGLDPEFARRAIAAGGHYGEIFERHLGEETPLGLSRGLNAQWNQGGLMYAPPFR